MEDTKVAEAEIMPQDVSELVRQGISLMRIENETMLKIAESRPRREDEVLQGALRELQLVPEMAPKAYYSIPFKDNRSQKIQLVQGLSIGAALALARRWGNCASAARCLSDDETGWDLEGVFLDLETNYRVCRPSRGSKLMSTKDGRTFLLDERRRAMAFGTAASKAQRNAILAGLPLYLREAYFAEARKIAGGDPDTAADPKKVKAAIDVFGKLGVTQDRLESYLDKVALDWTGEDVANLRGLWSAIQDKNITVAEAFTEQPSQGAAEGALTPETLSGGAVTAEDDAKHARELQEEKKARRK